MFVIKSVKWHHTGHFGNHLSSHDSSVGFPDRRWCFLSNTWRQIRRKRQRWRHEIQQGDGSPLCHFISFQTLHLTSCQPFRFLQDPNTDATSRKGDEEEGSTKIRKVPIGKRIFEFYDAPFTKFWFNTVGLLFVWKKNLLFYNRTWIHIYRSCSSYRFPIWDIWCCITTSSWWKWSDGHQYKSGLSYRTYLLLEQKKSDRWKPPNMASPHTESYVLNNAREF